MEQDLDLMLAKAKAMLDKAYIPYSRFAVGACIKSGSGQLYVGCNIENASYGLTLCAEAAAIAMMVIAGERQIAEMVVVAESAKPCAPCGACRQRIREFATPETRIHFGNKIQIDKTLTMAELLPDAFGPDNLQMS